MIGEIERTAERGRLRLGSAGSFRAALLALAVGSLAACDTGPAVEASTRAGGEPPPAAAPPRPVERDSGGSAAAPVEGAEVEKGRDTPPPSESRPAARQAVTFGEAERVFRTGEYGRAADLFEAYAERMPANPWGHYMLGISAWRAGDHRRAEAALRRTVEVDGSHTKGLLNLARVLLEQRKGSDALDFALRVVELEPARGEGWRVLGNAHAELRMTDPAVEAYRRAISLDPEDAWTMNNLGLLLIQHGEHQAALPPLARATELRPDVALFQNNLGAALERSGYPTQAAEAYRAALAADPGHRRARASLERVEAHVPVSTPAPVELAALAEAFADEVAGWQAERGLAEARR